LDANYWWSMMNQDVHEYCQTCDQCQRTCNLLTQNLVKLVIALPKKPFKKWGLDFIGHVKLISKMSSNWYILIAINYVTKWVEARAFHTNTTAITTKFMYEHILMRFRCLLTIVIDQGTHFINDVIRYLTNHFICKQTSFVIYYPQGS
jgi:hypothetical protein